MNKKLAIKGVYETLSVSPRDIIGMEADDKYTHFYINDEDDPKGWRKVTSSQTMKHYQALLREDGIIRVNKSQMVNLEQVKSVSSEHIITLYMQFMGTVALTKEFREEFYACHKS